MTTTQRRRPPTHRGGRAGRQARPTEAASGEKVTLSVSNLPPTTEQETRDAFLVRVEEFEAANPDIDVEPIGVRVGRRHVRRPDDRRHAADRVRDPVPRRPRSRRARPGRRHHRAGEDAAVRRPVQPQRAGRRPGRRASTSSASRSPPTASGCTTTASCSRRPGSIPTPRRRRGTRCASTPSRSPTRPGRPASPSCRRATPAAGCSPR